MLFDSNKIINLFQFTEYFSILRCWKKNQSPNNVVHVRALLFHTFISHCSKPVPSYDRLQQLTAGHSIAQHKPF